MSSPSRPVARLLARTYGPGTDSSSSAHYDKCAGLSQFVTSLNRTASEVMRTGAHDTGAQSSTRGALYGCYGLVAPYQCSGISGTPLGLFLQLLHVV